MAGESESESFVDGILMTGDKPNFVNTSCIKSFSGETPDFSTDLVGFGGKLDLSVTESIAFPTNFDGFGGKKLIIAFGGDISRARI